MKITQKTSITAYNVVEGKSIEEKIEKIMDNKEPIENERPLIYTERKDGVLPDYDMRADKWEVALSGMMAVEQSYANREMEENEEDESEPEDTDFIKGLEDQIGGTEPVNEQ